jgi:hypothetical protein
MYIILSDPQNSYPRIIPGSRWPTACRPTSKGRNHRQTRGRCTAGVALEANRGGALEQLPGTPWSGNGQQWKMADPLLAQFEGFVRDLTTVEKRNIVALTEIARDALTTHPHAIPSLAAVITNRVLQVRRSCNAAPSPLAAPDARLMRAMMSFLASDVRRRLLTSSCRCSTCWTALRRLWAGRTPPTLRRHCLR